MDPSAFARVVALVALGGVARPAHAEGPDAPRPPATAPVSRAQTDDVDLAALADGHSLRTNYVPQGLSDRYGRAQILIDAPMGIVHRLVLDFARYKDFTGGKLSTSRVIAKGPAGTDVYFQLSVLDGMITLWQVFRFQEIRPLARGWVMIEGFYVRGNIGKGNAAWTLRALEDGRTLLTFDLLVLPNVPLPQALVDRGLRNAAGEAVEAIRDRARAMVRDDGGAP